LTTSIAHNPTIQSPKTASTTVSGEFSDGDLG
jgi:hypothetical protein